MRQGQEKTYPAQVRRCTPPQAGARSSTRQKTDADDLEIGSTWGTWQEQQKGSLQHRHRMKGHQLLTPYAPQATSTPASSGNSYPRRPRRPLGGFTTPSRIAKKRPGSPRSSKTIPSGISSSNSKHKKRNSDNNEKKQATQMQLHPRRTKRLVEDVVMAFVADLERGETAPAPRDEAISEPVMSAGGETAPPDSDRGEHRTHNETGRRSTRRHRSQSTPANGNSCSTEKSVPPASRPASNAGELRGRKGV